MKSRLYPLLASALAMAVLAGGCTHTEKSESNADGTGPVVAQSQAQEKGAMPQINPASIPPGEAIAPAGPANADLLARKAETYSQSLQALLDQREKVQPAAKESSVEWMKKEEFAGGAAPAPQTRHDAIATNAPALKPEVMPAIDVKSSGPTKESDQTPGAPRTAELATNLRAGSATATGANSPGSIAVEEKNPTMPQSPAPGSIDAFDARLARRVKDYPRDVSAQLEYQLWLYLRDQPVPQLAVISSLPSEDREMLTAVMDALSNFRNTVRADNNTLLSKKIKPLIEMADRLRSQADLNVPKVTFCTEVRGFGQYVVMEPRFPANTETRTILYCEVENFAAQVNDQQQWTSDLKLEAVLYSEDSLQVWADKSELVHDVSRNRRHDFFIRKFVTLPKNLGVGRYLLKVSVTDLQANRIAETSLPITFVAQ